MKSWNLLSFEQFAPDVLSSVKTGPAVELPGNARRAQRTRTHTVLGLSVSAVLVAAISLVSVRVKVTGSAEELRFSSEAAITNFQTDRPPLTLLFGKKHPTKWGADEEQRMLERASLAIAKLSIHDNERNMIHSVLREQLTKDMSEISELVS